MLNYSSDVRAAIFGAVLVLLYFSCITVTFLCIPRFYVVYWVPCVYSMCDLVLPIWRNKRWMEWFFIVVKSTVCRL